MEKVKKPDQKNGCSKMGHSALAHRNDSLRYGPPGPVVSAPKRLCVISVLMG